MEERVGRKLMCSLPPIKQEEARALEHCAEDGKAPSSISSVGGSSFEGVELPWLVRSLPSNSSSIIFVLFITPHHHERSSACEPSPLCCHRYCWHQGRMLLDWPAPLVLE